MEKLLLVLVLSIFVSAVSARTNQKYFVSLQPSNVQTITLNAKFQTTKLDGKPTKVKGIIVYNFSKK